MRSKLRTITAFTPRSWVPFAAQSRDDRCRTLAAEHTVGVPSAM